MSFDLSAEDRQTADQFYQALAARNHKRLSNLEQAMERRRELVARIETGYRFIIEDYWNDVDTRTLLGELMDVLSPDGRASLARMLAPTDERFLRATRMIAEPWRSEGEARSWPWTWYRIPLLLVDELRNDVERMRL
ncbi:MAG TPA: hypothetical protein VFD32_10355 [Dehalococcoidia bacterium]|nr:hypothetical protein [Dehalococcoidia bacterium]